MIVCILHVCQDISWIMFVAAELADVEIGRATFDFKMIVSPSRGRSRSGRQVLFGNEGPVIARARFG